MPVTCWPATVGPYPDPAIPTGPPAPTGLVATTFGAARIDLSWTAAAGATSYVVERSPHGAGAWSAATWPGVIGGTTWKDPRLSASTAYDYRVKAVGPGGTSAPSATATASTTAAGSAPPQATEFNAGVWSSSAVNMAWNAVAGIAYYAILRGTDGVNYLPVGVTTGHSYRDSAALSPGTAYRYHLYTGGAGGETFNDINDPGLDKVNQGAYGPQVTLPAGAPVIPPGAFPAGVGTASSSGLCAAPASASSIQVRWLGVQAPEGVEASYILERSPDGSTGWAQVAAPAAGTWLYTDSGLSASTAYYYRFKAVGAGGTSAPSNVVSATTFAATAGRRLLRPEDLGYVGSFHPPFWLDAGQTINSAFPLGGLAIRYVGGQLRFLAYSDVASDVGRLYEFTAPVSLGTSPTFPQGTLVKLWGEPCQGHKLGWGGTTGAGSPALIDATNNQAYRSYGLFADPDVANRFWISYANDYQVTPANNPCLCRVDLDDGGGTISAVGPYLIPQGAASTGDPNSWKCGRGTGSVPRWFADASLNVSGRGSAGDRWLMNGFGGNAAGATNSSYGPCAFAWNNARMPGLECAVGMTGPESEGTIVPGDPAPVTPTVAVRTLVAYHDTNNVGHGPPAGGDPHATKAPGYPGGPNNGPCYGLVPESGGLAYFGPTDMVAGGGCWIDDDAGTRGKHGFLLAAALSHGYMQYKGTNVVSAFGVGGPAADGGAELCFGVLDPADLAAVVAGSKAVNAVGVNPPCWWQAGSYLADRRTVPYLGDDQGINSEGFAQSWVSGMAFDPTTNRLWVMQPNGLAIPPHQSVSPIIHCFQVAT